MAEIGADRDYALVPTSDTERRAGFKEARNWTPSSIDIFGHSIGVDLPTGNVTILRTDAACPYWGLAFGITRRYDVQEQHMQHSFYRDYVNVDPKPRWFSNWHFDYEADIDEVWNHSLSEIHLTGHTVNGLFRVVQPDFKRNTLSEAKVHSTLTKYGVPGRTLTEQGWTHRPHDVLLRTTRGAFQILTGGFAQASMVDELWADLLVFDPVTGGACKIASSFWFDIQADNRRNLGFPLVVAKTVDALGHSVELRPASSLPYDTFELADKTGRSFRLTLAEQILFLDGRKPGSQASRRVVTEVLHPPTIEGEPSTNKVSYLYDKEKLLSEVIYPGDGGEHVARYRYNHQEFPGVLSAIEDSYGNSVLFDYQEDPRDNDDRLRPRLKLTKLTLPDGITIEYSHDTAASSVTATVFSNGSADSVSTYSYIRDLQDSNKRYTTSRQIVVTRGYSLDGDNIVPRSINPSTLAWQTRYTQEGRFNVDRKIDPRGRETIFRYNDFNQLLQSTPPDGNWIKRYYDNPGNPSSPTPLRYDLLRIEREDPAPVGDQGGEVDAPEGHPSRAQTVHHRSPMGAAASTALARPSTRWSSRDP